jgi:hypothetical protein
MTELEQLQKDLQNKDKRDKIIITAMVTLRHYNNMLDERYDKCKRYRITTAKHLHYYLSYERDNWYKTVPANQELVSLAAFYTGVLLDVYKKYWSSITQKQQRQILKYITIEPTGDNIKTWHTDYGYSDNDIDILRPVNDDCMDCGNEDIEIINKVLK